jgi:hypothetical protein
MSRTNNCFVLVTALLTGLSGLGCSDTPQPPATSSRQTTGITPLVKYGPDLDGDLAPLNLLSEASRETVTFEGWLASRIVEPWEPVKLHLRVTGRDNRPPDWARSITAKVAISDGRGGSSVCRSELLISLKQAIAATSGLGWKLRGTESNICSNGWGSKISRSTDFTVTIDFCWADGMPISRMEGVVEVRPWNEPGKHTKE